MSTQHIKKLADIKEKMHALQQEEGKIQQEIMAELSRCLIASKALEVDVDVLMGAILEVIPESKINTTKTEAWKKSGSKFRSSIPSLNHPKKTKKAA